MPYADDRQDDAWDDEDLDDGESEEAACPACGRSVYEDADKCPHCGEWITPTGEAQRRSRTWFWPVLVVVLILMMLVAWHGLGR